MILDAWRHIVLTAVLVLAAGCTASGSAKTSVGSDAVDAVVGTVSGSVVDDAGLPIEGVTVNLQDAQNVSTVTDAGGAFQLVSVPVGTHNLVAAKVGYLTVQRAVTIVEGEPVEGVDISLNPIEVPAVPDIVVVQGKGFISCSFTTPAFATTYTQPCGIDPNNEPRFLFDVDVAKGLVGVVLELQWTPTTSATAQELRLGLWKNPTCGSKGCGTEKEYLPYVSGKSPLKKVQGNSSEPLRTDLDLDKPTRLGAMALVRDPAVAGENPVDVGLVWQQPVDFWASIFYNIDTYSTYSALSE